MGLILSILFSYVGAVELMFVVRDIIHQIGLHHEKMKFNRNLSKNTSSLHNLQDDLRKSIKSAQVRLCETHTIQSMVDGIQYEQGYRILPANEQDIERRWMEARASISTEPAHTMEANDVANHHVLANLNRKSRANEDQIDNDDTLSTDSVRRSSSISGDTIVKNMKINEPNDNNNVDVANEPNHLNSDDDDEVPDIHFDEYSSEYLHALDGAKKKVQHKNDDPHRRKSYKTFSGGAMSTHATDALQRRRSEDIDGETDNPWGELRPESFHDANLWSRERAMSIAENEEMMGFADEHSHRKSVKRDTKPLNSTSTTTNDDGKSARDSVKNETVGESDETPGSDVSNQIQSILTDSFEEIPPLDSGSSMAKIQGLPEILVERTDMDEIAGDGKMGESLDASNALQFKEYLEQPKRIRHSSHNYESDNENDDESNECSIGEDDERVDGEDLTNENKLCDFNAKRGINNRKPNMFALSPTSNQFSDENDSQNIYKPLIRITPTEDERIEQFLQEEHINGAQRSNSGGDIILIKSKTTQMFDCHDESVSDVDSYESDSRPNSPSIDVTRRESTVSDMGSEPIQFECKQPTENPNHFYNREDSSSSNKSNVLFERSQSRFSELEYIKGRDDWKDDYIRYDINEEIDSDNYHHLRRHSEAADTLEYIRGREDWIHNELQLRGRNQNSLPRIFEVGEPKMLIQDEIDSDEYHHNFFQNETIHSASESSAPLNKSCERDAQMGDIAEQLMERSINNMSKDVVDGTDIDTDASQLDFMDIDSKNAKRTDDATAELNKDDSMIATTNILFDKNNEINDINVVIGDLITHDATHSEDIEITVWDLTPEPQKNNPFILISEATDDSRDISTEHGLNQSIGLLHPDSMEITVSADESNNNHSSIDESCDSHNNNETNVKRSDTNKFLSDEIQSETKTRQPNPNQIEQKPEMNMESQLEYDTTQSANRNIRAKSENSACGVTMSLLHPNEQKPRRNLSFENVEDLVQDVSNGPFFRL